ncbi:MAG: hypothetical protein AAF591_06150 [Verrucomicrobiota bacterium]
MEENPYQTPQSLEVSAEAASVPEAERIRQEHIKHETSVRSIGLLYWLGGVIVILAGVGGIFDDREEMSSRIITASIFLLLGVLQLLTGSALRKLRKWARIPVGIISGIGLIGFPLGTIINAYILYLVFCKKGGMVFSDEYKEVIAATPHIKYKTSIIVWILLGILLLLLGLALVFAVFGGMTSG